MNLAQSDTRLLYHGFPVLGLPDERRAINYFSFNPFLPDAEHRCPLECAYCVCHQDSTWHHHPEQFADRVKPADLIAPLLDRVFEATPAAKRPILSLCDYSDPFLPAHHTCVLSTLNALIERRAASTIYLTTKVHPGARFLERLQATLARAIHLRVTVFVSLAPLKPGYEKASVERRVQLVQDLARLGLPICWYVRPLVEAWFDEAEMWRLARALLPHVAEHVVLSGYVMSDAIEESLAARRLAIPAYDAALAGRKQTEPQLEQRVRAILRAVAREQSRPLGPVMNHRRCGVQGNHGYACLKKNYCALFAEYHNDNAARAEANQQLKVLAGPNAATLCDSNCD